MNLDRMTSQQVADYSSISDENHIEVLKWMRDRYRKQIKSDKRSFVISVIAVILSILALLVTILLQ